MASYALPYESWCPGSKGDLIVFKRPARYDHYAVNVGNGYIVHRTAIDDSNSVDVLDGLRIASSANSGVAIIKKEMFKDVWKPGDEVKVESRQTTLSCEEIVRRALSKIGQIGYNLLWENCEHFARWCRYGEEKSEQADALKVAAGVAVGAGVLAGAAVLYKALSNSPSKEKNPRH